MDMVLLSLVLAFSLPLLYAVPFVFFSNRIAKSQSNPWDQINLHSDFSFTPQDTNSNLYSEDSFHLNQVRFINNRLARIILHYNAALFFYSVLCLILPCFLYQQFTTFFGGWVGTKQQQPGYVKFISRVFTSSTYWLT